MPDGYSESTFLGKLNTASDEEDTIMQCPSHFFEFTSEYPGRGFYGSNFSLDSAYQWALNSDAVGYNDTHNLNNWELAIRYFNDRNYDQAYSCLGHVLHLLQDMGSPAHVRNDGHGPELWGLGNYFAGQHLGEDYYEKYCTGNKKNATVSISGLGLIPLTEDTSNLKIYNLYDLFHGLAEFTGFRHCSNDTIFAGYNTPHPTNHCYTFTETFKIIVPINGIDTEVLHQIKYYKLKNSDPHNLAQGLVACYQNNKFSLETPDNKILESYWKDLTPEIVKYSASLLKLFQDECFPKIESIKQKGAQVNDIVTIIGKNFGEEYDQEESSLKFNGIELNATDIIKWSDKEILCKIPGSVIPEGAASGTLSVTAQVHAARSNEMAYDVGFMSYVATTAPEVYLASTSLQNQAAVTRQEQVPAGTFQMGSLAGEGNEDEHPQHEVCLDSYEISKYEVTNRQFAKFIYDTDYIPQGDWRLTQYEITGYPDSEEYLNYPVVNVSWNDAKAFCNWMNTSIIINDTKNIYSLPTEAQWEKAARGTDGRRYPWGNAWDNGRCNNIAGPALPGMLNLDGSRGTLEVGLFNGYNNIGNGASPCGAMDMAGNVWEWCLDWYDEHYYLNSPKDNPTGPEGGYGKVLRGGGWGGTDNVNGSRCAARSSAQPALWDTGIGFRCVRKLR